MQKASARSKKEDEICREAEKCEECERTRMGEGRREHAIMIRICHSQEFVRPFEAIGVEVAGEGLALVCPP